MTTEQTIPKELLEPTFPRKVTAEMARQALKLYTDHAHKGGPRPNQFIPPHRLDADILLADYITQSELAKAKASPSMTLDEAFKINKAMVNMNLYVDGIVDGTPAPRPKPGDAKAWPGGVA